MPLCGHLLLGTSMKQYTILGTVFFRVNSCNIFFFKHHSILGLITHTCHYRETTNQQTVCAITEVTLYTTKGLHHPSKLKEKANTALPLMV